MQISNLPLEINQDIIHYPISAYPPKINASKKENALAVRLVCKSWYLQTEEIYGQYLNKFLNNKIIKQFINYHYIKIKVHKKKDIETGWKIILSQAYQSNFKQVMGIYYKVLSEIKLISQGELMISTTRRDYPIAFSSDRLAALISSCNVIHNQNWAKILSSCRSISPIPSTQGNSTSKVSLREQRRSLKNGKAQTEMEKMPYIVGTPVLKHKDLDHLPRQIGYLPNVKTLDVSENHLSSLPEEIKRLTFMTKIDLSFNLFKQIPFCLNALSKLEVLNLSNNKLMELNISLLQDLSELKELDLSHNFISKLSFPEHLSKLKKLENLNLENNYLKAVPAEISELENLQTLKLEQNQLETLPASLASLKKLSVLTLIGNRLRSIPEELLHSQNTYIQTHPSLIIVVSKQTSTASKLVRSLSNKIFKIKS